MKSLSMKAELHSLIYLSNPGELHQLESAIDTYMKTIGLMKEIRFSYFTNESKLFLAEESANVFSVAINNIYLLSRKTSDESLTAWLTMLNGSTQESML